MKKEKKISIRPLSDKVLVAPSEEGGEKKLASGIILPATADKEKPMTGKVVATGPGRYEEGKLVPMQVKVGDMVLFGKYSHEEVKVEGIEYYLVAEANILAVIK